MSDRLKALREQRAKIVHDMREIIEGAEKEKRDMSDEELAKHGELFDEAEKVRGQITAEERQVELDRSLATAVADEEVDANRSRNPDQEQTTEQRQMVGFRRWLMSGTLAGDGSAEFRALQGTSDAEGGFLVAPMQFVQALIKFVDDMLFVRGAATVIPLTQGDSLGAPSLDADPEDGEWTTELATGGEDSQMAFGARQLEPHPLAKRIRVSNQLLQRSALPVERLVLERLGYKVGVTEEKGYLVGTGSNQPLGVYVASDQGISTGRDVSEGNNPTGITFDGLIAAKYSVKSQYWPRASWNFHRDVVKQISLLKDGEGQYLWRPSTREGEPDRVLNAPMWISEFSPNTMTSGSYVGLFGDWSFYWIADALNMQIQRLNELYAETNQTGFIARKETDGMPVLEEAFARVKLG